MRSVYKILLSEITALHSPIEKDINCLSSILHPEGSCNSFENVDIEVEQSDIQDLADNNLGLDNDDWELQEATQDATIESHELD